MAEWVNTVLSLMTEHWTVVVAVVVTAFVLLFLISRLTSSTKSESVVIPSRSMEEFPAARELPRMDDTEREQGEKDRYRALVADLRGDNKMLREQIDHLSHMNSMLAPLIKELNANVDRRKMGPLVLRVMERLFNPEQAMVFFTETESEDGPLVLVSKTGVSMISEGMSIPFGEGFLGMVARKRLLLHRDDLRHESNLVLQKLEESEDDELDVEIACPVVYRGKVLGVLAMQAPEEHAGELRSLFGMVADMTALAFANYLQYRKIEALANSDPLTGLFNKGYFIEVCQRMLEEADVKGHPMAILMLDLDNFKNFNDTNGHLAGDRLLHELGNILRAEVREEDLVARFGGEEFVVLLSQVRRAGAQEIAERIRRAICEFPFENREKQPLGCVSVSGGVASMPELGVTMEQLVGAADAALYEAKRSGRNRIVCARAKGDSERDAPEEAPAGQELVEEKTGPLA